MKLKHFLAFFLGPRTLKTALAASLSVFLCRLVPHSLPILAGTAAVICIQPSITTGLQKGYERAKTTIVAGLFGLAFYYLFGANLVVMGFAMVILIPVFRKMGWQEGIVLACITVIAIMGENAQNPFYYALGRVTSTLVGIAVATVTNIVLLPPRHQSTFRQELKHLTKSFPELYVKAVNAYAINKTELATEALKALAEAEAEINHLTTELEYLKTGAESRYGIYLEGVDVQALVLYERGVHFLHRVLAKIRDIVLVGQRRWEHKLKQVEQGTAKPRSQEFEQLIQSVLALAQMLGKLHHSVFSLVAETDVTLLPEIKQSKEEITALQEKVRLQLKNWQVEHIHDLDIFSLMSTHRIIFDLEEITNALIDLANKSISFSTAKAVKNKNVPLPGQLPLETVVQDRGLGDGSPEK